MNLGVRSAAADPTAVGAGIGDRFRDAGYVILPDLLDPSEVQALREEALAICRGQRGHIQGVQPAPDGEPDAGRRVCAADPLVDATRQGVDVAVRRRCALDCDSPERE